MPAAPRHLHDFFPGRPHPALQPQHQPRDARVLVSVHRTLREETPNLEVGKDYWVEGEVHEYAYFNLRPETPAGGRRRERVRAVFVGAWWDRGGAAAVFHTADAAQVYFRIPLARFMNGSVGVEGHGIAWPDPSTGGSGEEG